MIWTIINYTFQGESERGGTGKMNGCTKYKLAIAKLAFWSGDIRCEICPCLETYARKQCRLTGEYLVDTRVKGFTCPLVEVEAEEFYGRNDDLSVSQF